MTSAPPPHSPEYVTLREYFERRMEDYELYVSSQFEHAQTALALAAENVQREADRRVIVAGIVVTVINIVVSVYLRGRP